MNSKRSEVWKIFQKETENLAKCTMCNAVLKCAGGNTSSLANHLRAKHKIDVKINEEPPEKKAKTTSSLFSFIKRESMAELLAKCAAYDGFSIHAMTHSSIIREFFTKRGYEMPRSENTIKKIIVDFAKEKKNRVKG